MKRSVYWGLALLFVLLISTFLLSCSSDHEDLIVLEDSGYVEFKGSFIDPSLTGKYDVPLCSNETPSILQYTFRDTKDFTWVRTSEITIKNNEISLLDEVKLPVGIYSVEDIALFSASDNITHRAPNSNTIIFDFSAFSEYSLPYNIEILSETVTNTPADLMCYTSNILLLDGSVGGRTKIVDLETLYIHLPDEACVDRITIESDGMQIIDSDISGRGIRGFPIIAFFNLMTIRAYQGEILLETIPIDKYAPGDQITKKDVIKLGDICN